MKLTRKERRTLRKSKNNPTEDFEIEVNINNFPWRWMPYKEYLVLRERRNTLVWGKATGEDCNIKLAWVELNGERIMLGVDNQTMVGYEMEERIPTYKVPLIEKKYDKFIRWCTTFDV